MKNRYAAPSLGEESILGGAPIKNLAAVTTKIGSGATPRGGNAVYRNQGIAFIRSQNILDLSISPAGMAFIDDEAACALANVTVRRGDVLVNITGDSVARVSVWESDDDARVSQHVAIVRPDPARVNSRYLQYWLVAPSQKSRLLSLSAAGGSRKALTKSMLEQFPFGPHELLEQQGIAEVLGALDDKIAANRRVIENANQLWAMFAKKAQEKAPFVLLGSFLELKYGKALPAGSRNPGPVSVVGSGGTVGQHNIALLEGPAIVIGRKGNVGAAYWLDGPTFPIDTTFWVEPKGDVPLTYLFSLLDSIDLATMSSDSAVPGLNRNDAYALEVPLPSPEELQSFRAAVEPLILLLASLTTENTVLASTRDELLPLLMSGKITVRDAELAAEEAL